MFFASPSFHPSSTNMANEIHLYHQKPQNMFPQVRALFRKMQGQFSNPVSKHYSIFLASGVGLECSRSPWLCCWKFKLLGSKHGHSARRQWKQLQTGESWWTTDPSDTQITSEKTAFPECHETSEETCQGIRKYVLDKTSLKIPLTLLDNGMPIR